MRGHSIAKVDFLLITLTTMYIHVHVDNLNSTIPSMHHTCNI